MEVVATVRREKEVGQNDLNALVPSLLGSHRLPEICREHWQQEVFPWGVVKGFLQEKCGEKTSEGRLL